MDLHQVAVAIKPYLPVLLGMVVYPAAAAAINWALWFDTPAKWDAFSAKHPKWAFAIKVFRMANPHFRPLLLAWRDLAAARSTLPPPRAPEAPQGAPFDPEARQTVTPPPPSP